MKKEELVLGVIGKEKVLEKLNTKSSFKNGCKEWTWGLSKSGYAVVWFYGYSIRAHRLMYLIFNGKLIDGMVIDHECRNRKCINPKHLRQVTPRQNAIENNNGWSAINIKKTKCINGHKLNKNNIYNQPGTNFRYCRKCANLRERQSRLNKKLKSIEKKPCIICGDKKTDYCHIKTKGSSGNNEPYNIMFLCRKHHSEQHAVGLYRFLKKYPEVEKEIIRLGWKLEYIELPAGNVFRLSHDQMSEILRGEDGIRLN